jgi:hypothetical protein
VRRGQQAQVRPEATVGILEHGDRRAEQGHAHIRDAEAVGGGADRERVARSVELDGHGEREFGTGAL